MWFRDVIIEGEHQGHHTPVVQIGLRYGMTLFIASEVMFFVAWFWAYFNASLFYRTNRSYMASTRYSSNGSMAYTSNQY